MEDLGAKDDDDKKEDDVKKVNKELEDYKSVAEEAEKDVKEWYGDTLFEKLRDKWTK